MKTTLEQEDIKAIAEKVLEYLLPYLSPKQEDALLNVDGAAKLLDKSKAQIYQWVNNTAHGLFDFPYMKAGKSLRFSKNDLIAWMRKRGNTKEYPL